MFQLMTQNSFCQAREEHYNLTMILIGASCWHACGKGARGLCYAARAVTARACAASITARSARLLVKLRLQGLPNVFLSHELAPISVQQPPYLCGAFVEVTLCAKREIQVSVLTYY